MKPNLESTEMSKRVADTQITSDFPEENDDGNSTQFVKASSEVMAKRKILKPRGASSQGSNGFGGFQSTGSKGFGFKSAGFGLNGSQNSSSASTTKGGDDRNNRIRALNEKFIETINKANVPNTVVDLTSAAKKYIEYYQKIDSESNKLTEPVANSIPTAKPFSFTAASASTTSGPKSTPTAPSFNFSVPVTKPAPAVVPVSKPVPEAVATTASDAIDVDSHSDSDSEDEIKIEGPKFTLTSKPTVKKSPFSFGPKPEKKKVDSDSDSESEIEIKGPTFSFNKPIKDSVFKLAPSSTSALNSGTSTFSFGNAEKKEAPQSKDSEPKPAITFGSSTVNSGAASAPKQFSFSAQSTNPSETKPSVNFASFANSATASKPTFNFGSTSVTPSNLTANPPKPFSFGSGSSIVSSQKSSEQPSVTAGENSASTGSNPFSFPKKSVETNGSTSKSANTFVNGEETNNGQSKLFNFNTSTAKPENQEPPKPFSFGSSTFAANSSNGDALKSDSFSFDKTLNKKPEESSSVQEKKVNPFSFGSNADSAEKTAPKPFSFVSGLSGTNSEASKTSTFESNSSIPTKPFSFGSNAAPKDSTKPFSVDSNTTTNESSKVFTFGSSTTPKDVPKQFSFGSNSTTNEPSKLFSFTSNNNNASEKPKTGFSFGAPAAESKIGTATFGGFAAVSEQKSNNEDEDKVVEEETGGDFKPVASLAPEKIASPSTGEEDEENLFEKRAKLMLYDPENKEQPYTNKGLGDLKVLKNSQTQKSRILVRADGGLRVLLNSAVSKDFKYSTIGNGAMVRIPTVNPDTKKIETFVLKVKTPADGEELLNAINGAKS